MNHLIVKGKNSYVACINQCGFYGNPSWGNLCSRCYREAYLKQSSNKSAKVAISKVSSQAFSKFEAKRKKVADKSSSTVKNILKLSKDDYISNLPEEAAKAKREFTCILNKWKNSANCDVSTELSKLLQCLDSVVQTDMDAFSIAVQNFYSSISQKIYTHPFYNDASVEQKDGLINAIEKFLTVWIHPWAFTSRLTDDEEIDLKLQDKIRSLHWVTHVYLDAPINPNSPDQSKHLEAAILALISLNALLPTENKMDQIVECCRQIFKALDLHCLKNESSLKTIDQFSSNSTELGIPASSLDGKLLNTDDFLPTLIWVVLRANPPLLHSNLQFVMRFSNPARLNSGEAAYFFTNLCCAVSFITALTHTSLGMTEDEFATQMRDGVSVTLCPVEVPNALCEREKRFDALDDRIKNQEESISKMDKTFKSDFENLRLKISSLRKKNSLQKTVSLDPRELENPNILCLGPTLHDTTPSSTGPINSLLDQLTTDDDVLVPCLIPSKLP